MHQMHIYRSDTRGSAQTVFFPRSIEVNSVEDLVQAVEYDHICGAHSMGKRGNGTFLHTDCLPMDCDNGHSDDPGEWITPKMVAEKLPGVMFYAVYSRNHMREKKGSSHGSPRPRFHIYFPIDTVSNADEYRALKERVVQSFPFFDACAKDASRMLFGVEQPEAECYDGEYNLTDRIDTLPDIMPSNDECISIEEWEQQEAERGSLPAEISEGSRNTTMHKYASRFLMRYGEGDGQARKLYDELSDRCAPPLGEDELETIWRSAVSGYQQYVATHPDYIPPEIYGLPLEPKDYTDVGQAMIFVEQYGRRVRFSKATSWLVFDGAVWREDESQVVRLIHELTERQLTDARQRVRAAQDEEAVAAESGDSAAKSAARVKIKSAMDYRKFILNRRGSPAVSGTMAAVKPYVGIDVSLLDADGFMLNTPAGVVDLKSGELSNCTPEAYCTKMTAVSPDRKNADLFNDFLNRITCGDEELKDFLQMVAGMAAVGHVFCENLVIPYGAGGNGKSTMFNLLAAVLGDYAGGLSADSLMTSNRNKNPEFASLRGKRLVIAAELDEGKRLDTAALKRITSTDQIHAEPKYKDPFDFKPSHTTILYTNHLPKVGSMDDGTWNRLIPVPFNARFRGEENEIKDYAGYLFDRCGGAVLQWIIDGAVKFHKAEHKLPSPACVRELSEKYKQENDWLQNFLDEHCVLGQTLKQPAGALYTLYRNYCAETGDYARNTKDFKDAMENRGFVWKKTKRGAVYKGLAVPEKEFNLG